MLIGIDFDNTIVSYDALFLREGLGMGLIDPETPGDKKSIRDYIRQKFDDIAWQKLQGRVYGPMMQQAELIPGVLDFFKECTKRDVPFFIVSHKTEFANYDDTGTNLREASLAWMRRQDFFTDRSFQLKEEGIFFEGTRVDKISRIMELNCTHFIDDLKKVLLDESFANDIDKILLSSTEDALPGLAVCRNWREIARVIFKNE